MSILAKLALALLANALCERIRPTAYEEVVLVRIGVDGTLCVLTGDKKRRPWEAA